MENKQAELFQSSSQMGQKCILKQFFQWWR